MVGIDWYNIFLCRSGHFIQFLAKNILCIDPLLHPSDGWLGGKYILCTDLDISFKLVKICKLAPTYIKVGLENIFCAGVQISIHGKNGCS